MTRPSYDHGLVGYLLGLRFLDVMRSSLVGADAQKMVLRGHVGRCRSTQDAFAASRRVGWLVLGTIYQPFLWC